MLRMLAKHLLQAASGVASSALNHLPISRRAQAVDPKSDGAARDWVAIYDECSRILYQVPLYVAQ